MHPIAKVIARRISAGLKRKGIDKCSKWAEQYRVMGMPFPGPCRWDRHPWLLEMHDAKENTLVGQKAAQLGFTEWAMNVAFYNMDVLGHHVLYVLPTDKEAQRFSASRFDPALALSPHLKDFFADVNNVHLKRAGGTILYVEGSHSRSVLKSIPAPIMIWDEVAEMPEAAYSLGEERQSGQDYFLTLLLSTPTTPGMNINREFNYSTQDHFFFKCPKCSRHTELIYPDCLVVTAEEVFDKRVSDSHIICKECKNKLEHEAKSEFLKHALLGGTARYVPTHGGRTSRGFYVNQLYSMTKKCDPVQIAISVLKAINDPTREQELWNSKMGLPHTVAGAKVNDEQIDACIRNYVKGPTPRGGYKTMGIDVGARLHITIKEWYPRDQFMAGMSVNDKYFPRLLFEGTSSGRPDDFSEAFNLFGKYGCDAAVVDAEPERRSALQFANSLFGRVFLCDYLWSQTGREVIVHEELLTLKCNRTAWLDLTLGRYKSNDIMLPHDISDAFRTQIKEPTRVYKEDKWGNPFGVYENASADHFAHSDVYSELALPLAVGLGENRDIKGMY